MKRFHDSETAVSLLSSDDDDDDDAAELDDDDNDDDDDEYSDVRRSGGVGGDSRSGMVNRGIPKKSISREIRPLSKGKVEKKRKKRKTGGVEDFFLDEASVSGDEDEGEVPSENDEANDLFRDEDAGVAMADPALVQRNARRADQKEFMQDLLNQNEEEIEAYYKDLYERDEEGVDRFGDGDGMVDDISQQQLLPNVNDPNLWLVRCRIGEEKQTVINLLKKMCSMQFTGTPLQIKSALAMEGLRGYIYIEAFKQTHIKEAIDGVRALEMGRYKQQLVPIKEMPDVLKVVRSLDRLQPYQWVRVKHGLFRSDLAQVQQVEDAQNLVYLKLIPRIDYITPRGRFKTMNDGGGDSGPKLLRRFFRQRPPQALFDKDKIQKLGGEYIKENEFYIFEKNRYDEQGYLHKQFQLNKILTEGIQPTVSEAQAFNQTPEEVIASQHMKHTHSSNSSSLVAAGSSSLLFAAGDLVQVKSGELTNLQGVVLSLEGSNVTIKPNHSDLKDPILFAAKDLRKYFNEGDHVKIISGCHEGETGLVIRIEANEAILMSDLTLSEIKAAPKQLQLCQDRATGVDSSGHYIFGDLVMLGVSRAGVIVRLGRDFFQVLDHRGKVEQVKQNAIMRRLNQHNARTLDSNGHQLQPRDVVQVVDGPHSGHQGEIRHIYRQFVFLYSKTYMENSGLFVSRGIHVMLRGTENQNLRLGDNSNSGSNAATTRGSSGFTTKLMPRVPESPRIHEMNLAAYNENNANEANNHDGKNRFKHPGSRDGRGSGLARGGLRSGFSSGGSTPRGGGTLNSQGGGKYREERDLMGKTVRIIRGTMKGKFGIVKSATNTHCSVELHSEYRTELVQRVNIALVHDSGRIVTDSRPGSMMIGSMGTGGGLAAGTGGMTPVSARGMLMGSGGDTLGFGGQTPYFNAGGMTATRSHELSAPTPNATGNQTPHNSRNFDPSVVTPGDLSDENMCDDVSGNHGKLDNSFNPCDYTRSNPLRPPLMDSTYSEYRSSMDDDDMNL